MSHVELKSFNRAFNLRKEVSMPSTKDISSWRPYVEGGERKFCDFEIALLERFIKRMTAVQKKLDFPDLFKNDRQTAVYLWNEYVAARQTPSQAAKRERSMRTYVTTWGAALITAARKKLNRQLNSDPKMMAQMQRKRKSIETTKNVDYSKHRYGKAIVYREGPIRHQSKGKLSLTRIQVKKTPSTSQKPLHVAHLMEVDDDPVSSLFILNVANPKPIELLLKRDQNIGKYMVKPGRESPLRQSISCRELSVMEQDIEDLHHQLLDEVKNLKQIIEEFEEKNCVVCRPCRKLSSSPLSLPHKLDGR